eukprot:1061984-Prorocentrum_minimum.AAC.1
MIPIPTYAHRPAHYLRSSTTSPPKTHKTPSNFKKGGRSPARRTRKTPSPGPTYLTEVPSGGSPNRSQGGPNRSPGGAIRTAPAGVPRVDTSRANALAEERSAELLPESERGIK